MTTDRAGVGLALELLIRIWCVRTTWGNTTAHVVEISIFLSLLHMDVETLDYEAIGGDRYHALLQSKCEI